MLSQTQVFLFTIVIIVMFSVSVSTRHLIDVKLAYKENSNRLNNYKRNCPCGPPKETLVRLSDIIFTESIETTQIIKPHATVLHRCDPGQSCNLSHYCAPLQLKEVGLIFAVFDRDGRKYIEGLAQNHTECGCQPITSLPK